jgi:ribose transport system substrate-binding protein
MSTSSAKRTPRAVAAFGAVLAAALMLAGCGGDSSSGSTGADAADDVVTAAKATIAKAQERPTALELGEPVTVEIPADVSLTFINCGLPSCNLEADIIKSATDELGWDLSVINTDGTPEKTKAAWQQVVRDKPDALLYVASERSIFEDELAQVKANGTFVAACCVTDEPENGIDFVVHDLASSEPLGQLEAAFALAHQDQGDAIFVGLPAFPIVKAVQDAYVAKMESDCAECAREVLEIPLTALGKDVPDRIVSYLRSHPKTKTVVLANEAFGIGLPAALDAAGLDDLQIIGYGPDTTILQYLADGSRSQTIVFPYFEDMYAMVDSVVRHVTDMDVAPKRQVPTWIVTTDTLPSSTELFPVVADLQDQYFALWGLV